MTNHQEPEPPVRGDGALLDVHSLFFTLQGEGPFSGQRAVFLRLAGCNLRCPGCDTEYTRGREALGVGTISEQVTRLSEDRTGSRVLVVITGGEPLRQPIGALVCALLTKGHAVQIESNGTCGPDPVLHQALRDRDLWQDLALVISPKTKSIHPECHWLATAFKYVLDHRSVNPDDGLPDCALLHERGQGVARPRPGAPVYLTPFDAEGDAEMDAAEMLKLNILRMTQSCMKHGYIGGVQLHKILELP